MLSDHIEPIKAQLVAKSLSRELRRREKLHDFIINGDGSEVQEKNANDPLEKLKQLEELQNRIYMKSSSILSKKLSSSTSNANGKTPKLDA